METINIYINRKGSYLSRHVPYEVWFRGVKLGTIIKDADGQFTIPRMKGVLKLRELGSKIAFHKIEKEIVIFPEYIQNARDMLNCDVTATTIWLGVLTYGLFAPIRKLNISINY